MKSLLYSLIILLFASTAHASFQYEQILGFDEDKDLPILNERFRRLEDKVFQVKSSSTDTTPAYLDNSILNITVIGDVTDGTVAGWNIDATYLYNLQSGTPIASPNDGLVLSSGNEGMTIYENTEKRVEVGYLSAGVYGIKGYADDGTTPLFELSDTQLMLAGWTFGASTLTSTNLTIDSGNELIKSNDYTSGALGSGWQIDATQAEFQNIVARGKITTSAFEIGAISTIGGNVLISHDTDVLNADMTALDASTMTIDGDVTFAVGDHLRIKDGTDDEWLTVSAAGSAPTYSVTRDRDSAYAVNTNPVWTTGTAVVNYGQNLDGGIFMTASESNAPYISVYTIDATPWNSGITTRMRMGNLNGYLGYSSDLYGIAIGEATKYLKYDPTNGLQIKGIITASSGSDLGDSNQLTHNGDFEVWTAGNAAAPDSWNIQNGTVAREDTTIKMGTYSAEITGEVAADTILYSDDFSLVATGGKGIDYYKSRALALSVWVYCDTASMVYCTIWDGVTHYSTGYHGGTGWELLTATGTQSASATTIKVYCYVDQDTPAVVAYFDGAMLVEGSVAKAYTSRNYSEGWVHPTDTTKIDGGDIYTGTVTADKVTAGTFIGGAFVIGDGGSIQSTNYVANTSGIYIDHETIELNEGSIAGEGILETIMIYSMLFGGD